MTDMMNAIAPKSDQINSDDLIGTTKTITITEVTISQGQDQPVSISFEGSPKFFRPCKSMSRVLVNGWGPDAKEYIGRSLTLYRDPKVKWGGMEVGGIRISHMSHIEKPMNMVLTVTKATRAPYVVRPMETPKPITPERDSRKVADNLIKAMTSATSYEEWSSRRNNDRFKADEAFINDTAPAMAGEVLKAIGDAKQRIDSASQGASDDDGYGSDSDLLDTQGADT